MKDCPDCELLRIKVAMLAGEAKAYRALAERAISQTDEALASAARMADTINRYMDEREKCIERHVSSPGPGRNGPGFLEGKEN